LQLTQCWLYLFGMFAYKHIAVIGDSTTSSKEGLAKLLNNNQDIIDISSNLDRAGEFDVVVVLGGDGFMLHTIHHYLDSGVKLPVFYGMNCGSIGFMMNVFSSENLDSRLARSTTTLIHPLKMMAKTKNGEVVEALAINEVSILRTTAQAAHIKITIDGKEEMACLVSDGVLVSTPAGSTAYNSSVGGAIIPLNADLLALTPISPFRPRRWHGALLPQYVKIELEVLDAEKRDCSAFADSFEVDNVVSVSVAATRDKEVHLLFDEGHSLEERIIREQFIF
jgi:NAD+ kinase